MNEPSERAQDPSRPGEINDFAALVRVLWQRRVFIVSGFLILTLIGALGVLLAPRRFRAEAFFRVGSLANQINGMSIPIFKQGEVLLHDLGHLRALMSLDPAIGKDELEGFFRRHRDKRGLQKYFSPVTNFVKMAELSRNEGNSVIGFKLAYVGNASEQARKFVDFFAKYIRSSYLAIALDEYILVNFASHNRIITECDNTEIELGRKLKSLNKQKAKMEVLAKRFPKFSTADEKQIEKMPRSSINFMSPTWRLNSIESQLMAFDTAAEENALRKEISIISLQFFSRARQLLAQKKKNGTDLLAALQALRTDWSAANSQKTPELRQAENTLILELQRFQNAYFGAFDFVAGPTVSPADALPARIWLMLFIAILSLLLMAGVALLFHWGSRNWKRIAG